MKAAAVDYYALARECEDLEPALLNGRLLAIVFGILAFGNEFLEVAYRRGGGDEQKRRAA